MAPATFTASTFTVMNTTLGTTVAGSVSYSASARTATFTPTTPDGLATNNAFTATVTSNATDVAGNALAGNSAILPNAGNHVWSFSSGALADTVAPTVTAISPADGSSGACRTRTVTATFSEPMDPATITATTFRVTDNGVAVAGSVTYDAATRVASFVATEASGFAASRTFAVMVVSGANGVKDLAGNPLAIDRAWGFSTGTQPCTAPVDLGSAASFAAFGGTAGVTNQGINTVVNGNLGTTAACTLITGFHDAANGYTETPLNIGAVNGSVYCAPPAPGTTTTLAIATQARADAQTAYNALAAMPPGGDPGAGQLGGLVLPPAVYTSAGGTFAVTTGDLTLDAQGDVNAVWVFQSAAALTVGQSATPRRVFMINGAQAKNVFWQVGSAARIEDGSTMVGTIIAPAGGDGLDRRTDRADHARRACHRPHRFGDAGQYHDRRTVSARTANGRGATARRNDMTAPKALRLLSLASLGSLLAVSALAQEAAYPYVGASIGQSRAEIDEERITAALSAAGLTTTSMSRDERDTAYKLFGGWQFNRHVAVEAGYFNLGRFGFTSTTVPAGSLNGRIRLQGVNLDVVGTLPLTERLSLIGRVGGQYASARDAFSGTGAVNVVDPDPSKRSFGYKAGAGLQYEVSRSFLVRLEAERYRINDAVGNRGDVNLFSARARVPLRSRADGGGAACDAGTRSRRAGARSSSRPHRRRLSWWWLPRRPRWHPRADASASRPTRCSRSTRPSSDRKGAPRSSASPRI
jgi:opacity protein-like surface antigen